jgi:hypothetical protein
LSYEGSGCPFPLPVPNATENAMSKMFLKSSIKAISFVLNPPYGVSLSLWNMQDHKVF